MNKIVAIFILATSLSVAASVSAFASATETTPLRRVFNLAQRTEQLQTRINRKYGNMQVETGGKIYWVRNMELKNQQLIFYLGQTADKVDRKIVVSRSAVLTEDHESIYTLVVGGEHKLFFSSNESINEFLVDVRVLFGLDNSRPVDKSKETWWYDCIVKFCCFLPWLDLEG